MCKQSIKINCKGLRVSFKLTSKSMARLSVHEVLSQILLCKASSKISEESLRRNYLSRRKLNCSGREIVKSEKSCADKTSFSARCESLALCLIVRWLMAMTRQRKKQKKKKHESSAKILSSIRNRALKKRSQMTEGKERKAGKGWRRKNVKIKVRCDDKASSGLEKLITQCLAIRSFLCSFYQTSNETPPVLPHKFGTLNAHTKATLKALKKEKNDSYRILYIDFGRMAENSIARFMWIVRFQIATYP